MLVVDEVLEVGDAEFQKKAPFRLFVSHKAEKLAAYPLTPNFSFPIPAEPPGSFFYALSLAIISLLCSQKLPFPLQNSKKIVQS